MIREAAINEHKSKYEKWIFDTTLDYQEYSLSKGLGKRIRYLSEEPLLVVLGAGMSETTGPFYKEWEQYKEDVTSEDPESLTGFCDYFEYGGIEAIPKSGIEVIPNLVRMGKMPVFLVFNYNCHLELCLVLCDVGYESISYNGKNTFEVTRVGRPKCTIFKPHGSSRLIDRPTQIIWPDWPSKKGEPENRGQFELLNHKIREKKIKNSAILGYSGNWDPYMKKHMQRISEKCSMIQFGLPRNVARPPATTKWGILEKNGFITDFDKGGTDFLYGLSKLNGLSRQCTTKQKSPLSTLSEKLEQIDIETTSLSIESTH
ncbi:MAG: hypothetical protein JW779_14625 [Candidatus Thorarchaeota archaeon]|nr:hypothetical protein [Candidatus Thorarchaeota archaeon]